MPRKSNNYKMEKSKKIKGLNALDWIIIIILVFCAVCFGLRYREKQEVINTASEGKYRISFQVKDVRYTTADAFVSGDKVFVATDNVCIGTFEALDSNNPAAHYEEDMKGGFIKVYYPEGTRVDLTGTIISEGLMNDDGFFVGGSYFLAPGKQFTIYTGHVFVEIVVTGVSEIIS